MRYSLALALCAAFAVPSARAASGKLQVRVLSDAEAQALPSAPGVQAIPVGGPGFKTAAHVSTTAGGQSSASSSKVSRNEAATSGAYAGSAPFVSPPNSQPGSQPQTPPPPPTGDQLYAFKNSGDAGQAFAAMTSTGVPYATALGDGQYSAVADASWRRPLQFPSPGKWNAWLKFTIPAVHVMGTFEENGPSSFRLRARLSVMLDGHPVWSTEAMRFNETKPIPGLGSYPDTCDFGQNFEIAKHLQQYGYPIDLGKADLFFDEPANPSAPVPVTLYLGAFDAANAPDLEFLVQTEAYNDNRCCRRKSDKEWFCTQSVARVDYNESATPTLYIQPVKTVGQ